MARTLPLFALVSVNWLVDDYTTNFVLFASFCAVACYQVHRYMRPLFLIVSTYLLVALPNISSWRGYVEPFTLKLYAAALLALYLPFAHIPARFRFKTGELRIGPNGKLLMTGHLLIAYAAVAYLYAMHGVIILQQELRFGVPPAIEYIVKSPLPLAAFAPFCFRKPRTQLLFIVAVVLPTILLGARGAALVALLSYVLCRGYVHPATTVKRRVSKKVVLGVAAVFAFLVISTGFYLRRAAGGQLAAASVIARTYFESESWWVYAIMPFHLGFRETVGLTNQIVTGGHRNEVNEYPLFFADLVTVLPGEQLAAGQSLGQVFGAVDAGGLTPGLLGGLYIDYSEFAIVFFFGIGLMLVWCLRKASKRIYFVPFFAVLLMQVLHVFHRGFLKPEYLTTLLVAGCYMLFARSRAIPDDYEQGSPRFL